MNSVDNVFIIKKMYATTGTGTWIVVIVTHFVLKHLLSDAKLFTHVRVCSYCHSVSLFGVSARSFV